MTNENTCVGADHDGGLWVQLEAGEVAEEVIAIRELQVMY